jgi:hypothetical protein
MKLISRLDSLVHALLGKAMREPHGVTSQKTPFFRESNVFFRVYTGKPRFIAFVGDPEIYQLIRICSGTTEIERRI